MLQWHDNRMWSQSLSPPMTCCCQHMNNVLFELYVMTSVHFPSRCFVGLSLKPRCVGGMCYTDNSLCVNMVLTSVDRLFGFRNRQTKTRGGKPLNNVTTARCSRAQCDSKSVSIHWNHGWHSCWHQTYVPKYTFSAIDCLFWRLIAHKWGCHWPDETIINTD